MEFYQKQTANVKHTGVDKRVDCTVKWSVSRVNVKKIKTRCYGNGCQDILHTCPTRPVCRHLFKFTPLTNVIICVVSTVANYSSVMSCPLLWMILMTDWTTSDVVP